MLDGVLFIVEAPHEELSCLHFDFSLSLSPPLSLYGIANVV